jgi:rfaE bifunctional protein kinase chain/domain
VSREESRIGGAGNVAANISLLGADASLMSIVGRDSAADELLHVLKEKNIKESLVYDSLVSTTIKTRVVAQQQQLIRLDFEGQPSGETSLALMKLFTTEVNKYDAVIFSDYGKGVLRDIEALIDVSRDAGKLVFVDPKGNNFSKYKHSSFLTPNKKELEAVTGSWASESELDAKAIELRNDLGLQGLLVTRSEEGMTLYRESGKLHFPTRAKEVFDVSGAGDTVIAVFGALVAGGFSLEEASSLANKAAGVVVGKVGTATVTFDELFSGEVQR